MAAPGVTFWGTQVIGTIYTYRGVLYSTKNCTVQYCISDKYAPFLYNRPVQIEK